MKAILGFARAIADEARLRVICLASGRWISEADLHHLLPMAARDLNAQIRLLVEAGVLKSQKKASGPCYRVRRKQHSVVEHILAGIRLSAKAVQTLRRDAKSAKHLRIEHHKAKVAAKAKKKAAAKSNPTAKSKAPGGKRRAAKSAKPKGPAVKKTARAGSPATNSRAKRVSGEGSARPAEPPAPKVAASVIPRTEPAVPEGGS